jgi:hypothetical protein
MLLLVSVDADVNSNDTVNGVDGVDAVDVVDVVASVGRC